eukprot:766448-Hanusia_phi.AAC.8
MALVSKVPWNVLRIARKPATCLLVFLFVPVPLSLSGVLLSALTALCLRSSPPLTSPRLLSVCTGCSPCCDRTMANNLPATQ